MSRIAGYDRELARSAGNDERLFVALSPFIEAISDDEASMSGLPRAAKACRRIDRFGLRVERRVVEFCLPRPGWDESPAHGPRAGFPVLALRFSTTPTAASFEHRAGTFYPRKLGLPPSPSRRFWVRLSRAAHGHRLGGVAAGLPCRALS